MRKSIITSVCFLMLCSAGMASALQYNGADDNKGNGQSVGNLSDEFKLQWLNKLKKDLEQYIDYLQVKSVSEDLDKITGNNGKHWGQLFQKLSRDNHGPGREDIDTDTTPQDSAPVPEPATLLLLGSGLSGLAMWGKRRKLLS